MDARFSYRETSARGANPVRLVICLYEQAIEDLRRALLALEKGQIEIRTKQINHALMVIAQLEGSLDMQQGGEVAQNLAKFYAILRRGLTEAQMKQSATLLQEQIAQLVTVHEAWLEVERATESAVAQYAEPVADTSTLTPRAPLSDWSA